MAVALVVFRRFVRRDYLRRGRLTGLSSFLEFLVFFLFGTFTWLDLPSDWLLQDINPVLRIIGWSAITIGLSVTIVLIVWFGWLRAMGRRVDELKQTGLYRISRNPQIVACFVAVLGYALLWPTWHTLGWVTLFSMIGHLMVLTEEEHLGRVFGDKYLQYCARVPRYVSIRWPFSRLGI
jgi:protein-S-isoprenylcysteine O-methyltransferase Ste14